MKKTGVFISMFIAMIVITACGGGGGGGVDTQPAPSNSINYVLPNGSTLSVPSGGTTMSTNAGESISTAITISGGSVGMNVAFSSSVTPSTSTSSVSTALESQIVVTFEPLMLTSGGTSSSKITVVVDSTTPTGSYLVNLKTSYVYQSTPSVDTGIGAIKVVVTVVSPTPTPTLGTIAFSPESTTMHIGESFSSVLTLSGAQNLPGNVVVTLASSSNSAIVSPATCTLSMATNTCNVVVTAESAGNALINASATDYTINPFNIVSITSISLPQTGQTPTLPVNPALVGMDGYTYIGVPWAYVTSGATTPVTRFTVGTGAEANCVTDNLTGLMWVKNLSTVKITGAVAGTATTWQNALTSIANANLGSGYCGHYDWYLPTVNDLASLVNYDSTDLQGWLSMQGFISILNSPWSSTTVGESISAAWVVDFNYGDEKTFSKTSTLFVWPVRLAQ